MKSVFGSPYLRLNFHLGSLNGLVGAGLVGQGLIGVSQLLLNSTMLAVSSLRKNTSLLLAILHDSCPAVFGDVCVSSGRLGHVDSSLTLTSKWKNLRLHKRKM